jgi:hypothetical protein
MVRSTRGVAALGLLANRIPWKMNPVVNALRTEAGVIIRLPCGEERDGNDLSRIR